MGKNTPYLTRLKDEIWDTRKSCTKQQIVALGENSWDKETACSQIFMSIAISSNLSAHCS